MSKYTPGPWHVDEHGAIRGGDLSIVATRHRLPMEVHTANAHLIAAAPDLLQALKEAVEVFCIEVPFGNKTIAQMRAAIAKAEGRK